MSALAPNNQSVSRESPSTGTARLHVDWTRCDGRGLCAELLTELLERRLGLSPDPRRGTRHHSASSAARACGRRRGRLPSPRPPPFSVIMKASVYMKASVIMMDRAGSNRTDPS